MFFTRPIVPLPPILPFLFLFPVVCQADLFGTVQSAAVQGNLLCNGRPSAGTKVKLYDVDTFDPDDLMDEGITDDAGHFELKGHETEMTNIDPKVNIYHDCNDEQIPCLLKFSIKIPDTYITHNNEEATKTFDIGTINLDGAFSGQSRDCFNK